MGPRPRHQNPPTRTRMQPALTLLLLLLRCCFRWVGLLTRGVWVGFAQDAEARPVESGVGAPLVGPGAGVPPPPQQAFGVEAAPAVDATLPVLKRKAAEGPQPWLDVDGVTPPAPKIRRLVRTPSPRLRSLSPWFRSDR